MTFGEKIQLLRKEKSISQEEFAEVMNVSRQAVSKWELNQSYPEVDKIIEIQMPKKNSGNNLAEIYKVIILAALAIALTSIRFFILGDFKVGIILITVSCIFMVGFFLTRKPGGQERREEKS